MVEPTVAPQRPPAALGQLTLALEPRPHPLPHSLAAPWQLWGRITLSFAQHGQRHELLNLDWSLDTLAAWLASAPGALWQEPLYVAGHGPLPGESLAQAVARLRASPHPGDAGDFEQAEAVWQYAERHNLRRALAGAALPDIYLGCNHGAGEVSAFEGGLAWAHAFDLPPFIRRLRADLQAVLAPWAVACAHPPARARAERLLAAIRRYPT